MRRSEEGFTLLEVIVALAIATASIASLYQIYAVGWRGVRLASLDRAAIEVAKNQLASAGVETPLTEGTSSGVSAGGVEWTTEIRPYEPADAVVTLNEPDGPAAYWVSVKVAWREGLLRPQRTLDLTTIKLVARK